MELRDKIQNIIARNPSISDAVIEMTNLVLIPLAKEAFEAGGRWIEESSFPSEEPAPDVDEWIESKFGSNKL